MPIPQSRILELLRAAEDYQQAYDEVRENIERVHYEVSQHGNDPRAALDSIYTQVQFAQNKYQNSLAIILLNRQHYRKEEKRNVRRKIRRLAKGASASTISESIIAHGRVPLLESPEIQRSLDIIDEIERRGPSLSLREIEQRKRVREEEAARTLIMGPDAGASPRIADQAPPDAQRNDRVLAEREAADEAELTKQGLDFGEEEETALPISAPILSAKITHPDAVQFSDEVLESIAAKAEAKLAERPAGVGEYTTGKVKGQTI